MPTSIHVELIKQGVIKDPYKGMNEYDVQVSFQRLPVLEFAVDRRHPLCPAVGWRNRLAVQNRGYRNSRTSSFTIC